jgi:para-nitrobenzyl esterase
MNRETKKSADIFSSVGLSRRAVLRSSLIGGSAVVGYELLAGASSAAFAAKTSEGTSAGVVVETNSGKIRGIYHDGVHVFRGVPYAASTAPPFRFMPPRKAEPWNGVRDAFQNGHEARQIHPENGNPAGSGGRANVLQGDDCLVVNIFTPSVNDARKRPVMLWLHGGSYGYGSGMALEYDGTNLARTYDVVVLSINHRLNLFGYLYLGAKDERYADSGMAGMLDIVASLEWIRDNISNFGGNPGNVTVFGQSGGGGKVSTLLAMPLAKGLFHKAIVESGSTLRQVPADAAQKTTDRVLAKLGIDMTQLDQLQQIPPDKLLQAALTSPPGDASGNMVRLAPVVDGRSLPHDPFEPTAPEVSADVPLLVGTVETEGTYFTQVDMLAMDEDAMRTQLHRRFGDATDTVIETFRKSRPKATPSELYFIITSFPMAAITQAERKSALKKAPAFLYLFAWRTPVDDGRLLTPHTIEISFVFDNVWLMPEMVGTGPEIQPLADKMSATWTTFARTGNPHVSTLPPWPAYDAANRSTMIMNNEWSVVNDPTREERLTLLKRPGQTAD